MKTIHKSSHMAPAVLAGMLAFCTAPATAQTLPPERMNYQGVLRDQNGNPLTGTYDMVFRFMDAATGGNEILVDGHTAANSNAVIVAGGLFDVVLGTGTVTDGSGPGTYTVLSAVFRDHTNVWLEIQVGPETLSPRTPIHSAPFALNASNLDGRPAGYFIDTSATSQAKAGELSIQTPISTTVLGIDSGTTSGIRVTGNSQVAGYFKTDAPSSRGVQGWGELFGGAFYADDPNGNGVYGQGSRNGGRFSGDGVGVVAFGDTGLEANGWMGPGGVFNSSFNQSTATLASTVGIDARGRFLAGYFSNDTVGVETRIADGSVGIRASGNNVGGEFTNGSSYGQVPYADRGIHAVGSWIGGSFKNNAYPATEALVAVGDVGIQAGGPSYGSYLYNGSPNFSYAYIPNADRGITAWGSVVGGDFHNFSSGSWAYVGYNAYKILGSGSVSFVQNHPQDPSKVIVYAAPEGDEVAVYTRGSGRLVNGEARVALGGTFALVTNPDIGLTATATPRGEPIPLAVKQVSPTELVVQGPAGSDADFDYMVWGLRIGFEEQSIVQPKQEEAKIPSMHMHAQYFQEEPALRDHTALARFQGIEASVRGKESFDFSRSQQLLAAVGVAPKGEPAPPTDAPGPRRDVPAASHGPSAEGASDPAGTQGAPVIREAGDGTVVSTRTAAADNAGSSRALAQGVDLFQAAERIEPGDMVSLSKDTAGHVVRSAGPDDALLIGCAQPVETDPGTVAVASIRIALCRVDASFGAVSIGDRLTASPVPGLAMRMSADTIGAQVLGRAIEPLEAGTALVRVLLGVK